MVFNKNKGYLSLTDKAMDFAKDKHKGQLDDEGKDYYKAHLRPVTIMICELTKDEEVRAAAALHDTVEDTDTTYEELVEIFGKKVADLVMEVTHEGKADGYGYYFPRLKSVEAQIIKMCDRASNLSRMESWSEKRRKQYMKNSKFWKDGSDRK